MRKIVAKVAAVVGLQMAVSLAVAAPQAPAVKGMPYDKARPIILAAGWTPAKSTEQVDAGSLAADLHKQGFVEIVDCAPSGASPCYGYFENTIGNRLRIHTAGEEMPVITAAEVEGAIAKQDAKPDAQAAGSEKVDVIQEYFRRISPQAQTAAKAMHKAYRDMMVLEMRESSSPEQAKDAINRFCYGERYAMTKRKSAWLQVVATNSPADQTYQIKQYILNSKAARQEKEQANDVKGALQIDVDAFSTIFVANTSFSENSLMSFSDALCSEAREEAKQIVASESSRSIN